MTPDIESMTFAELTELRNAIQERMKDMRETGIVQLRATLVEQSQLLGVDLADLLPKKGKRKYTRRQQSGDA